MLGSIVVDVVVAGARVVVVVEVVVGAAVVVVVVGAAVVVVVVGARGVVVVVGARVVVGFRVVVVVVSGICDVVCVTGLFVTVSVCVGCNVGYSVVVDTFKIRRLQTSSNAVQITFVYVAMPFTLSTICGEIPGGHSTYCGSVPTSTPNVSLVPLHCIEVHICYVMSYRGVILTAPRGALMHRDSSP